MLEFQLSSFIYAFLAVAWIAYPIFIGAVLLQLRRNRKLVQGKILNLKIVPISEHLHREPRNNAPHQPQSNSIVIANS